MISKTKIKERMKRKKNPEIVSTIILAEKNNLLEVAKKLSAPISQQAKLNLAEINSLKENKIMIIGKVLGQGSIDKKISISALSFSEQAKEKLKKAGCEILTIRKEIENNPKLSGVKII